MSQHTPNAAKPTAWENGRSYQKQLDAADLERVKGQRDALLAAAKQALIDFLAGRDLNPLAAAIADVEGRAS